MRFENTERDGGDKGETENNNKTVDGNRLRGKGEFFDEKADDGGDEKRYNEFLVGFKANKFLVEGVTE